MESPKEQLALSRFHLYSMNKWILDIIYIFIWVIVVKTLIILFIYCLYTNDSFDYIMTSIEIQIVLKIGYESEVNRKDNGRNIELCKGRVKLL